MSKNLIKSVVLLLALTLVGFYFFKNKNRENEPINSGVATISQVGTLNEETHEGYLAKYKDFYVFSECYDGKIYILPGAINLKYQNVSSSVSVSLLNKDDNLSLEKIEVLTKKCDSKDDVQLIQDKLVGYGVMSENEAYIQDGHDLVVDQTKKIDAKSIFIFQFLHYGDPFSLYQDTLTIEKGVLVDDKYKIKDMNPEDIFKAEGKIAIFFSPSDADIEEMKKGDEEGFYVGTDDSKYHQSVAGEFLNKKNIKTVYTNKRYINLKRDNSEAGDEIMLDTKSINQDGGLFLFDGKTYPILADITNIEPDFNKYFK